MDQSAKQKSYLEYSEEKYEQDDSFIKNASKAPK